VNASPNPDSFGRLLIIIGVVLVILGVLFSFARVLRLGSLPGDLHWSGRGWQIWLPLGTSILLSVLLTLLFNLFFRRR
jgi:membrane protein implicated in regulation of membrane protease activity